jgi:hypothetical protein
MLKVEIKGKSADRFRAYAVAPLLRSPNADDIHRRAAAGKQPYPARTKIQYDGEEPLIEGDVKGEGLSLGVPKGKTVTRIAFYKGEVSEEVCVGSVDVNAGGRIEIEFAEPVDTSAPNIVKEGE